MKDCIFCTIVAKKIPNYTVYEDSHVLAFLDIHPRAKGHTVLIPKVHAETIFDLNEEIAKSLLPAVERTADRIEHVLSPDGYNIGWNHGEAGGQEVSHLHIHILPRWHGDGGTNIHGIVNHPGEMSVEEVGALFS
ncbi:MAG: HIT family protein [Candidatus Magasanikbacteria bacterium CG10_big_fil_rev_8_21_14_0_10_42_10]|uniref:HIT family protein n=2 Tax=Candidatus Magasanikiibacteriota TaxID=1752731 RepID=A0A2H0TV35_9BACT|nr:MAG: HIT family protein [Candidatus Magasanikbacteria bacterium CG10_big_fil_rev_8_21_14_0_10_42_10]PIZ94008.1 MAG: HIT family protein [Candidatus Magasanikbacteria bacterium CG_4_10_14_0_2_um_filter_41_10]